MSSTYRSTATRSPDELAKFRPKPGLDLAAFKGSFATIGVLMTSIVAGVVMLTLIATEPVGFVGQVVPEGLVELGNVSISRTPMGIETASAPVLVPQHNLTVQARATGITVAGLDGTVVSRIAFPNDCMNLVVQSCSYHVKLGQHAIVITRGRARGGERRTIVVLDERGRRANDTILDRFGSRLGDGTQLLLALFCVGICGAAFSLRAAHRRYVSRMTEIAQELEATASLSATQEADQEAAMSGIVMQKELNASLMVMTLIVLMATAMIGIQLFIQR